MGRKNVLLQSFVAVVGHDNKTYCRMELLCRHSHKKKYGNDHHGKKKCTKTMLWIIDLDVNL